MRLKTVSDSWPLVPDAMLREVLDSGLTPIQYAELCESAYDCRLQDLRDNVTDHRAFRLQTGQNDSARMRECQESQAEVRRLEAMRVRESALKQVAEVLRG